MLHMELRERVLELKHRKNALILAHNYQMGEVQSVADCIGDSLGLAKVAMEAHKKLIVFCGVRFMAETAKILNPAAKVLIPREDATCPMADMIEPADVARLRSEYPGAVVCSYVNTNADVKAITDVCCTSANAVEVVRGLGAERVIFTPDRNLASYVGRKVNTEIIPFDGYCYVHMKFTAEDIRRAKAAHPGAIALVHPECRPEVIDEADEVLSTSGMMEYAKESPAREFIIATEEGLIGRMSREMPDKRFYSAGKARFCFNMKRIRLEDVHRSLDEEIYEIDVPGEIMEKARVSLERMVSGGRQGKARS
jgi:quinolinate synthase